MASVNVRLGHHLLMVGVTYVRKFQEFLREIKYPFGQDASVKGHFVYNESRAGIKSAYFSAFGLDLWLLAIICT